MPKGSTIDDVVLSQAILILKNKPSDLDPYTQFETRIDRVVRKLEPLAHKYGKKKFNIALDILQNALHDYHPKTEDTLRRKKNVQESYRNLVFDFYGGTVNGLVKAVKDERLSIPDAYTLIVRKDKNEPVTVLLAHLEILNDNYPSQPVDKKSS